MLCIMKLGGGGKRGGHTSTQTMKHLFQEYLSNSPFGFLPLMHLLQGVLNCLDISTVYARLKVTNDERDKREMDNIIFPILQATQSPNKSGPLS